MILIGDKGMDTPHLVWLCGALSSVCTFRDYFVAALFVPPSAGRTDNEGHSLRSVCTFRGYFAPSGLVPLLRNGANRHPRLAVRSPLLCRSDVVLPLKAQPKKKEMQKHFFRDYFAPSGLVPLLRNGANRGFSSRKNTKKKRNAKAFLFFLVHFQGLEPWAH